LFYYVTKYLCIFKKIPEEMSRSNKEFLSNCVISIGKHFEHLNDNLWTITNKQYDNVDSKSLKFDRKPSKVHLYNDKFTSYSNILAYNNNKLDKMILAHVYGQRFNDVY